MNTKFKSNLENIPKLLLAVWYVVKTCVEAWLFVGGVEVTVFFLGLYVNKHTIVAEDLAMKGVSGKQIYFVWDELFKVHVLLAMVCAALFFLSEYYSKKRKSNFSKDVPKFR